MNIYALTDSHQEARNLAMIFSGIYSLEESLSNPFLVLDCGDLFKGIYDKNLSVDLYLEFKKTFPQAKIVLTLGNNDFGFVKSDFEYLQSTIDKFSDAGIFVVCANLNNIKESKTLVPEYKIIDTGLQKILVTGFCLNNSCAKKFGYELIDPQIAYKNLIDTVDEPYDKVIVLNHHWYPYSKALKEYSQSIGKEIDLIIGGHEHSVIAPDFENNIYYPLSFARSFYFISESLKKIEQIDIKTVEPIENFLIPVEEYEKETQLFAPVVKRVLNLVKSYSQPCPLGTFISDNMKRVAKTDIAFHSTGFTMYHLSTKDSDVITKYDFDHVMCASTAISKIVITVEELKKVFENATSKRMYKNNGNARFLQCSHNIKLTGRGNLDDLSYRIVQIEINGEKLLDENSKPIDPKREYTCAIDNYIGNGEQGFEVLANIQKIPVTDNAGKNVKLKDLLLESLKIAQNKYSFKTEYPAFELIDL